MNKKKINRNHYNYVKRCVKKLEEKRETTQEERIKRAEYLAEMCVYENQNKGGKL